MNWDLLFAPAVGVFAIIFSAYLTRDLLRRPKGTTRMIEISDAIREGAHAYLARQFLVASFFAVGITTLLGFVLGIQVAVSFALGAILSGVSAYVGMRVSIYTNSRAAHAACKSLKDALSVSSKGGTIAGLSLAGLGIAGVGLMYLVVGDPMLLLGMGFGASLIGLFARVGGGIYTKAADIGADLVGKIEEGIPEDDPRNAAVIADQVGDNVGDIAGTGSDVFQSYVMALVAAMILGLGVYGTRGLVYPLTVAGLGIIASLAASFFIRSKGGNAQRAIYRAVYIAAIIVIVLSAILSWLVFGGFKEFYATAVGVVTIVLLAWITLYYTSDTRNPVQSIAKASVGGPAMNIIFGFARSFESTVFSVIVFTVAVVLAYLFSGVFGIAMVAVGFLSITATLIAMSAYGPIVDNAKGVIELSGAFKDAECDSLRVIDELDAVGNTTKAVCKVYALGTSAFAQVAIFSAFVQATGLSAINVANPIVASGLIIGGMLSFLFVSQILRAIGNSAFNMVAEVRRQFKEIPGLREGKAKADYAKCVDISTRGALKGMFLPAIFALIVPLAVGYTIGVEAVGGLIAGNLVTTIPLGLMMIQGGAAWDNAKKYVEKGNLGGPGTKLHAATIVGDTVGDPLKDATGPSLDFLMNLIGSMAVLFAASFITFALL
ncbi:MAG TPA: sodium-translocating pyrophosphatase [Candidatus Bathyarchaeia archaeon]|nr:sodium-translocating pyrophosphatase [Candidatus Bathyarchaeia archaeon]